MESSERRVDLSRLIRLDQVEDIMNKMMERINLQDETIRSLQKLCGGLLSKQRANDAFGSIQSSLIDINTRLDELKTAATADVGGGRSLPAGEVSALNNLKLQELTAAVAKCANHVDVQKELEKQRERQEADMAELHGSLTPLELSKTLHKAQNDAAERMKSLESLLALKIDRSEMANIQTLATSLEEYDYFRSDTQQTLRKQKELNEANENQYRAIDKRLNDAREERSEMQQDIAMRATSVQVERLAGDLHQLEVLTSDYASKNSLDELDKLCESEFSRLGTAVTDISALKAGLSAAKESLETKASTEDMNKRVLRSHYNEVVTALGTDIDSKASKVNVDGVDQRVFTLEERIEAESARLSVAMRFVDWFTSRGESYEHNLRLVDKHLRGLTKAADPSERQPYTGQVRFTRNADENSGNAGPTGEPNIGSSFSHL